MQFGGAKLCVHACVHSGVWNIESVFIYLELSTIGTQMHET